jgi:hypothetical protein
VPHSQPLACDRWLQPDYRQPRKTQTPKRFSVFGAQERVPIKV